MMKKFKKIFICSFLILATCCFGFFGLKHKSTNQATETADAAALDVAVFNYVSLSQSGPDGQGQIIDSSKLKTVVEDETETTYIITNNSVTINFEPLSYNYALTENTYLDNFNEPIVEKIIVEKGENAAQRPTVFQFKDKKNQTFYAKVDSSNNVSIYKYEITPTSSPTVSSVSSNLVKLVETTDTFEIHLITAYSTKNTGFVDGEGNPTYNCEFGFSVGTGNPYILNFQKPVVNFFNLTEPVVMFNTFLKDDLGHEYPAEKAIAPDQVFNKLQISFINNDYTEGNPLYFNINYNGFVYNYELYSKVINSENLLFVNYIDEYSNSSENISYKNSEYLATSYVTDSQKNLIIDESTGKPIVKDKVYAKNGLDFNEFSLIFKNTGRYSIEFYDSTHLLGMNYANYYSTSFFIREESESVSPFQNIYVVGQTFTDEGEPVEYIVSDSTLNYSTKITIKNLGDFGKDTGGKEITLADVVEKIVIRKTDFGIDHVETLDTTYAVDQILENLNNNDFTLDFHDDAYYQVLVYPKQPTEEGAEKLDPVHFVFTIVKFAKTTYTFNDVIYEATKEFKTEIKNYTNPIKDSIKLNIKFTLSAETTKTLQKTFVNRFQIKFGVKRVNIEEFTPIVGDNESVPDGMYIRVYGVGDITVYITLNGVTETLVMNSEQNRNSISRTEYGIYTVRIVDSMGSEMTSTFEVKKELNMSAIILLVLIAIVALFVTLFILKARGRVATR